MERPRLSFEVPLNHLYDFDEDQDYIFSLSFLFKDLRYQKYIRSSNKEHILDNSYNELGEPQPLSEMLALYNDYRPNKMISPDSDSWGSKQMLDIYEEAAAYIGRDKTIGVARTLEELEAYSALGVPTVAIPYEHRLCLNPYDLPLLQHIHFLGLNNLMEVFVYTPATIDTSMPIKLALKNWTVPEWVLRGCPHIHTKDLIQECDFFNMTLTTKQIDLSKKNINYLKEALHYGKPFPGILHSSK